VFKVDLNRLFVTSNLVKQITLKIILSVAERGIEYRRNSQTW